MLIGGAVFPLLGAIHHWYPKITGRMMGERCGLWVVGLLFVGFNLIFFPMHIPAAFRTTLMPFAVARLRWKPGTVPLASGSLADRFRCPNPCGGGRVPGQVTPQRHQGIRTMGLFTKPIKTLDDLFIHTLQDMYYAEQQITKNLPTMVEKATNPELKSAFQHHLTETENHVRRLEQVFRSLGQEAKGVDCEAMDGILDEAKTVISDCGDPDVCDAAMLSAAQAVEHYEMTRYGTLIAFARQLGRQNVVQPLSQTLEEEKSADKKLTGIAESRVNRRAA